MNEGVEVLFRFLFLLHQLSHSPLNGQGFTLEIVHATDVVATAVVVLGVEQTE
jgi:hypothetical protein